MPEDPFFIVKDEVEKSISHLQGLYDNWNRMNGNRLSKSPQFNPEQFKWTADEIKSSIKTIEWDIQDLEETVRIVEANPQKFHLESSEVARRRAFVEQSKSTIDRIFNTVRNASTQTPVIDNPLMPKSPSGGTSKHNNNQSNQPINNSYSTSPNYNDSEDLIRQEQSQQLMIMEHQDQHMDKVYSTVVNLKNIAVTMGNELEDQQDLLNDLDSKVDNTGNRLQNAMSRIQHVLKTEDVDRRTFCCIIFLIIIVFILLITLIVG